MISKRRIAKLENSGSKLPEGYAVRKLGFQKWELSFEGEPLKVYEREAWAQNAAVRHQHRSIACGADTGGGAIIRKERTMYPVYKIQVYSHIQGEWIDSASHEASNLPHHYDVLRGEFERLVSGAKDGSPRQAPIGYRIVKNTDTVVDTWTNGKVE